MLGRYNMLGRIRTHIQIPLSYNNTFTTYLCNMLGRIRATVKIPLSYNQHVTTYLMQHVIWQIRFNKTKVK